MTEKLEPGYWMYETSGALRPAVEAYLRGGPLYQAHVAALRAYLRQWIGSPAWDRNPHAGDDERRWLSEMRIRVETLTTRAAIARWIDDATDGGLDPL
jgi:hypothetical protein